jgi:hypothetical protein
MWNAKSSDSLAVRVASGSIDFQGRGTWFGSKSNDFESLATERVDNSAVVSDSVPLWSCEYFLSHFNKWNGSFSSTLISKYIIGYLIGQPLFFFFFLIQEVMYVSFFCNENSLIGGIACLKVKQT